MLLTPLHSPTQGEISDPFRFTTFYIHFALVLCALISRIAPGCLSHSWPGLHLTGLARFHPATLPYIPHTPGRRSLKPDAPPWLRSFKDILSSPSLCFPAPPSRCHFLCHSETPESCCFRAL